MFIDIWRMKDGSGIIGLFLSFKWSPVHYSPSPDRSLLLGLVGSGEELLLIGTTAGPRDKTSSVNLQYIDSEERGQKSQEEIKFFLC